MHDTVIEAEDMDNDGDVDLVVTNLRSKDISILRNLQSQTGFGFEPGESYSLGEFPAAVQLRAAVGDVNQDGVLDLAVANGTNDDNVSVFLNTLVGGAHRVGLTGVETVTGLNFGILSLNVPPTLNTINDPPAILEDDPQVKSIPLSGITDGASGENQPLAVTVATSNSSLFSQLDVSYIPNATTGTVNFLVAEDANGAAVVTVTVADGGSDRDLGTAADNGTFSRSFTVTVSAVNDNP